AQREHRDAVRAAIVAYLALHVAVGLVFNAFVLDQMRRGELAPDQAGALRNWGLWQSFTLAVGLISAAALWAGEAGS
ncbi:MAG: hypothetical protein B7Z53_03545, partial [Rhodospirillales bacterium 12-71-4]